MGWWPFSNRKSKHIITDNIHIKGTNIWLTELRELCERHFDDSEKGKLEISLMKNVWEKAKSNEELDLILIEGLFLRADKLLLADEKEWLQILDDDEFWKPGWRPSDEEE